MLCTVVHNSGNFFYHAMSLVHIAVKCLYPAMPMNHCAAYAYDNAVFVIYIEVKSLCELYLWFKV